MTRLGKMAEFTTGVEDQTVSWSHGGTCLYIVSNIVDLSYSGTRTELFSLVFLVCDSVWCNRIGPVAMLKPVS